MHLPVLGRSSFSAPCSDNNFAKSIYLVAARGVGVKLRRSESPWNDSCNSGMKPCASARGERHRQSLLRSCDIFRGDPHTVRIPQTNQQVLLARWVRGE